jgi:uncharacterized phiE125 gp8 family phage protein
MAEPVSLAEIKKHLDVVRDDQDALIQGMGIAAREWVENYTGLVLVQRQVTEVAASFNALRSISAWPLPLAPETTIRYIDTAGAEQVLTGFAIRAWNRPATISPDAGGRWPMGGPVAVTFLAGYSKPEDVPGSLKAAVLLLVGNLYANRETTVTGASLADTGTIESLCRPYRMPVIG